MHTDKKQHEKASASQNRGSASQNRNWGNGKCNLCGKVAPPEQTLSEASAWAVDHGCNYGKPELAQYFDGDGLSIRAVQSKPRETIKLLKDYKAHAEALAEALRDARNYIWESGYFNTDSPLIAQIDDALAKWKAGQ